MKTIVIANNKGGVGKTTVASQIAFYLGRAGYSVIAVDLDGQRNLTSAMGGTRVVGNALQMLEGGEAPSFFVDPGEVVLIEGGRDVPVSSDDTVLQGTVAGDRQVVSRDRKWGCATFCHAAMLFAQSFQRSNAATRL